MRRWRSVPTGRCSRVALFGVAAIVTVHLQLTAAWAQGSTGGSIGKQNKSASGSLGEPRSRSAPPSEKTPKSNRGGSYDGMWDAASFGQTCSLSVAGVVTIASGKMTADGLTGAVSGNGSVTASWAGMGLTATFTGRISGRNGAGKFQRSDGCVGRWTMVKR